LKIHCDFCSEFPIRYTIIFIRIFTPLLLELILCAETTGCECSSPAAVTAKMSTNFTKGFEVHIFLHCDLTLRKEKMYSL